jgi:H+/Cl- antiporter ClcA/PII-like signaling protein
MKVLLNPFPHVSNLVHLIKWSALVVPVAILVGSASALFLTVLERATHLQWQYAWLLFLLPVAGILVGLLYHYLGRSVEGGNNLIMDQIHEPGGGVPMRMAPLVFIATVLTHLFGGSAGREGTAVQMGGSIASAYSRWFRISPENTRVLLMSGVAAGFGSVFGTPLTGAIFAMEVLMVGRIEYDALIPTLIASIVGDLACAAWGVKHAAYHIAFAQPGGSVSPLFHLDPTLLGKAALAGAAFGLAGFLFSELAHGLQRGFKKLVPFAPCRPILGGVLVIALTYLIGTRDYLGLGVSASHPDGVSILTAFNPGGAHAWSWWWKLLFTAVTLASGFKGGEVTPLFFIGATLGNTLAVLLGGPVDLFAGLGFVAVFAGSTNTPLACTVMGAELFGAHYLVYFAVACFVAYFFSGHSGIYMSQRVAVPKRQHGGFIPAESSLREVRELSHEIAGLELTIFQTRFPSQNGSDTDHDHLNEETNDMPNRHKIVSTEMGKVRIYMKPREKIKTKGMLAKLNAKPLYREIINSAKADGLTNAVAFHTHYGFSNNEAIQVEGAEIPNANLTLCVELIGHKDALETFCRKHGDLLKGKVVVYKHIEQWSIQPNHHLHKTEEPSDIL